MISQQRNKKKAVLKIIQNSKAKDKRLKIKKKVYINKST